MNQSSSEILAAASQLHRADSLDQAEALYRQVLFASPEHAPALHLLGVLALQRGQQDVALALIDRAIALDRSVAEFHNNRGSVLRAKGDLAGAAEAFARAIQLNPRYARAHQNLGLVQ